MKGGILTLTATFILSILTNCKEDEQKIGPDLSIVGEWKYEYELLSDGSKEYDNPYALLEFEYSDGFILNDNNTGNSVWYDKINGDFEWATDDSKLIISVKRANNSVDNFEYYISNLEESSMEFETPKGAKYLMRRQ